MDETRGFLPVGSGLVHYRLAGTGPPLILLHQTPDSSRSWQPLTPLLARHFRTIAIDTPGYGESAALTETPTMDAYAAIVADVMSGLGIERAAVVGHHTGAAIAVELAAGRPDMVAALIAIGLPFWPATGVDRFASLPPPTPVAADGSHVLAYWQRIRDRAPDAPPDVVQRRLVDQLIAPDPTIAYQAVYRYDMAARLPMLRCPVLILSGADDELRAAGELAAPSIADCQVESIAGAGVSVVDLFPDMVAERIVTFLDRPGGAATSA